MDRVKFVMNFSGNGPETQRGCFNKALLEIIIDTEEGSSMEMGCHKFPEKYGQGTICVCDSSLCNGGPKGLSPTPTYRLWAMGLLTATVITRLL